MPRGIKNTAKTVATETSIDALVTARVRAEVTRVFLPFIASLAGATVIRRTRGTANGAVAKAKGRPGPKPKSKT